MIEKKLIRITTVPISLFSLLPGQLRYMSQYYEVISVSSEGKLRRLVEEREGIRTIPIEMTRKISPIQDLKSVWDLYKLFKKEKPFIVHSHTPKAGIAGMLAAMLAGVPHRLHTVGGLPLIIEKGIQYKILYLVEKATYLCATRVYPISYGIKNYILDKNIASEKKVSIIANGSSNGIDTGHFTPSCISENDKLYLKNKLDIEENDFVFIFVGRLVKDKGINELVSAFVALKEVRSNIKLLLVGPFEGDLNPINQENLDEINTNRNIISVGFQKDVRPYLAISKVLVFPSYREGFGNVIAQAGSMGLPSIVSNITGCNEIIIEGENGVIIPSKDTNAIYNAMLRFIDDNDLLNKLKSNARRMIVERYEQQVVWEAILAEYKRLESMKVENARQ